MSRCLLNTFKENDLKMCVSLISESVHMDCNFEPCEALVPTFVKSSGMLEGFTPRRDDPVKN